MNDKKEKNIDEYPTASEVFIIENILKNSEDSAVNFTEVFKKSKKINTDKINQILLYLEKTKKIIIDKKNKKIIYISNPSPKLLSSIKKGFEYG